MLSFTHFSMMNLASFLVLFVTLVEVWRSATPGPARRRFMAFLIGCCLYISGVVLDTATYSLGPRPYFEFQFPAVFFEILAYVEYCRHVAGLNNRKYVIATRLFAGTVVTIWLYVLYGAIASDVAYESHVFYALLPVPIFFSCYNFVLLGVLLFKKTRVFPLFYYSLWKAIDRDDHQGKAVYSLYGVATLFVIGSFMPLFNFKTILPQELTFGLYYLNGLAIIGVSVVSFFMYVERRACLATKITTVLTVAFLSTAVLAVLAFYEEQVASTSQDISVLSHNSIIIEPVDGGGYQALKTPTSWIDAPAIYHAGSENGITLDLPFPFPFYGQVFQQIRILPSGQVIPLQTGRQPATTAYSSIFCLRNVPIAAALCVPGANYQVRTHIDAQGAIITWANPAVMESGAAQNVSQLVLRPDGSVELNYAAVPLSDSVIRDTGIGIHNGVDKKLTTQNLSALPIATKAPMMWFDLNEGRRATVHDQLWPLAASMLFTVLALMFVVRPYLTCTIVRPLSAVSAIVQNVDDGSYERHLMLRSKDEFGDIAQGFNRMIVSLNQARERADEQTELLETELTRRTITAATVGDEHILSQDEAFEQQIKDVISENIANFDYQVAELASDMGMSTRQLHRKVVDLTAETPAALIRSLRLEHAYQLLSNNAANISQAAHRSGFKDVSYFSRRFQQRFDITPKELRTQKA